METCSKRNVMGLSIAQIVFSAAFFLLGMVDGFHIQFVHVSPMFLPCWIAALVGNISNDNYYLLNVDLHYSWFSRVLLTLCLLGFIPCQVISDNRNDM